MVFSNQREWINTITLFSKWQKKCWILFEIFSEATTNRKNAPFCLSVNTWETDGAGVENSDLAACFGSTFFVVEGIISIFSAGICSWWISASDWRNYCTNWLRSESCFHINWFAAWVCSDEKASVGCSCNFIIRFRFSTVSISK